MWIASLQNLGLRVRVAEPLGRHTSLQVGGRAAAVVSVDNVEELVRLVDHLLRWGISYYVLGRGTNVLVSDRGFQGAVIKLGDGFGRVDVEGELLKVGAAVPLPRLAVVAARAGLTGLEWSAGIPGSLGGAVMGNAGAYGGTMADLVQSVGVFYPERGVITHEASALGFSYRKLVLPFEGGIILGSQLRLKKGANEEIWARMENYKLERRRKQPLKLPNAGSVFCNPPGDYAGRLIEAAGLKGLRVGDAAISDQHANFIVNLGHATAADILKLLILIRQRILAEKGVVLKLEWKLLGFTPAEERALEIVA
ncbi:MAG: UDP-N-acetylmuramate dehydrogenase [Limnochordia bacterium]|nr:UDP-N-acetylmuramate dehydrogenase [Limnochordia bacterium]MDD2629765.1 UDP-N-acetylmuramate dehydrogenase [Limnochordia bacterium]